MELSKAFDCINPFVPNVPFLYPRKTSLTDLVKALEIEPELTAYW